MGTLTFGSLPALAPREGPCVPAPTAPTAQGAPQRIIQGAWSATGSATALVGAAASVILANNRKQGRKTSLSAMPPTVQEVPEWMQGTGGPRPEDFFDPAGLARGKTEEQLLELRAQEIKHGRTATLAVLGWFHKCWSPLHWRCCGTNPGVR